MEEWLIKKAQSGDEEAFTAIVTAYQQQIYGLAFRFFNNRFDAEDAAQETIIKIYHALPGYHGAGTFSSWIYSVCANTCRDILRKRKRSNVISLDEDENGDYFTPVNQRREECPEEYTLDHESQALIRQAVAQLPEAFRSALVLREFAQMSYEEIAEALSLAPGTVKSRISRGRKLLRIIILEIREQEAATDRHIG